MELLVIVVGTVETVENSGSRRSEPVFAFTAVVGNGVRDGAVLCTG
jgi:hypothetical protein